MQEFDAIVIGAGPAGEVAAGQLAEGGLKTAIVEQELVGGECAFYACMPSKALLRPAEVLAEARRIPGAAEAASGELDVAAVLRRRDEVIHDRDDTANLAWLEDRGITLLRGHAELTGERRLRVGDEEFVVKRVVVLANGSDALMPPIEGLAEARAWTNREITTASDVPESIIIIGGGPVGSEMAQAWASLGSHVTLVEGERRLLPREEVFACEQVTDALQKQGVTVRCGQTAQSIKRDDAQVSVTLADGQAISAIELVICVGRKPRTKNLGLERFGIDPSKPLPIDDVMRVNGSDWLYAVGDVNGRVLLTHMGKYQARVAGDFILKGSPAVANPADRELSPRVTFTDPQVAAVGHTEATAIKAGLNFRAVDVGTSANAGGSFYGRNAPGTTRIIVDEDKKVIVGATITGSEVSDFIHAATIAIVGEVPIERLWHAVPCFPTRSEVWLRLLEEYGL